jgi:hypothetical protein
MSRTTLCLWTAAVLAVSSAAVMITRHQVLGADVKLPVDPGTWKVTLLVSGRSTGDARLWTSTPLDFGRQHVLREVYKSDELIDRPPDARNPGRRQVVWAQRPEYAGGPFRAQYEFYCTTSMARPTAPMNQLAETITAAPQRGQYLHAEPAIQSDDPEIAQLARELTARLARPTDVAEALFRYVDLEIGNEPTIPGRVATARECLAHQHGDSRAKSRLLAALLRNRGIPARLVTGLALARGREQTAHVWVEAWVRDHWLPMCPFYHAYARLPRTYLVFGPGDLTLVRGSNVRNLEYRFLVERVATVTATVQPPAPPSLLRRVLTFASFHALPPTEQRLVEFLLLVPVAALIVCVWRNIIGIGSFGTFAPALLGLAFRELHSMPGILLVISIILTGWLFRRMLDRYHLLQVPRQSVLLTLVVLMLIGAIVLAAHRNLPATRYVPLFPIVILTGMIERFWTLEAEDGTVSSFRTLLSTILIAISISLVLSLRAVVVHLYRYPETLGIVMALQLLIGRYTGYRLTELYRFRDFLQEDGPRDPDDVICARVPGDLRSPFVR